MRAARLLLLAFPLAATLACAPELRGECTVQADCPTGTVCEGGLCLASGTSGGDGGAPVCAEACAANFHCESGACVADFAASAMIEAPAAGAVVSEAPLPVRVAARAPDGVVSVGVALDDGGEVPALRQADGSWAATLDLADSAVRPGLHVLVARARTTAGATASSDAVSIQVDKAGPVVEALAPAYPARTDGHPARGAFLRNEQVVVEARIADEPAGLGAEVPTLEAAGMPPVKGASAGDGRWRFAFDGRAPRFPLSEGDLAYSIRVKDRFGHATVLAAGVRMSRLAWRWTKPGLQPLRTAPALAGDKLFVGGDEGRVYGIRRVDGTTGWTHEVGAAVVGHLTAGATLVYAMTREGRLHGLRMEETLPTSLQRQALRCPDAPTDGPLLPTSAGVALGRTVVSSTDARSVETLFGVSSSGVLRMYRGEAFPVNGSTRLGCVNGDEADLGTNTEAMVPALVEEGGTTAAYVGNRDGKVMRYVVTRNNGNGVLRFDKAWERSVRWGGNLARVIAPPALMPWGAGHAVVAGLDVGAVRGLDAAGSQTWPDPQTTPLPGAVDASPVVDADGVTIVDERGRAQELALTNGRAQRWPRDFNGPARGPGARASPVLAADGRTYVATGPQLAALATDGTAEWSWDTRPGGLGAVQSYVDVGTPALACDGTLYVPFSDATSGGVVALITDSRELAHVAWPKAGHDNRNTHHSGTTLPGTACAD